MSDLKQVAQSEPPEPAHVERTVIAKQRHVTLTDAGHVDRTTGEILDTKPITGMDGKTHTRTHRFPGAGKVVRIRYEDC